MPRGRKSKSKSKSKKYQPQAQKWFLAAVGAALFLILNSPQLYRLTNELLSPFNIQTVTDDGAPTALGLVLHAIVFLLIVRFTMK